MNYTLVKTRLGWCALAGEGKSIKRVILPEPSKEIARKIILSEYPLSQESDSGLEQAKKALIGYFEGKTKRFDFTFDLSGYTEFEKDVYAALRKIPYGKVTSYGKLARAAGIPRGARAVGNVMAKNKLPLLIPCHRVIKSDGSLGFFSIRRKNEGTLLKKQLLELEATNV